MFYEDGCFWKEIAHASGERSLRHRCVHKGPDWQQGLRFLSLVKRGWRACIGPATDVEATSEHKLDGGEVLSAEEEAEEEDKEQQ